ncbi:MAG: hypothetical protein KAZ14_02975 [Nitrosomonas sp.]|jgi:hypothetical protein|nr:hypothetical protein [Nitrosomonas sp.]MBP7954107.1 hypothetical protein [Nitrosomonas sp.]
MKLLSKKLLMICSVALSLTIAQVATAAGEQWTDRSLIYVVESGWGADTYSVKLVTDSSIGGVYTNPAGCPSPQAGYVTSTTDAGRKLYQDQLREAFLRNLPVKLLISSTDCPFNKPRIISVSLCRPNTDHALNC